MPSGAGVGLWLPDVGGVGLYLTLLGVGLRPSDLKALYVHPAAVASDASVALLGALSPPPERAKNAIAATTTTAIATMPPIRSVRLRDAACEAARSASSRSSRRRCFSS